MQECKICKFNFAILLNYIKLYRRGKPWTSNYISDIINEKNKMNISKR